MNVDPRVDALIRTLDLEAHPEGGFYRETWRAPLQVSPADGRGTRTALTVIYFLLPAGAVSRWHRVRSDEAWIHLEGAPLELLEITEDPWRLHRVALGPFAPAQEPVHCVPAGRWQAARSRGGYTLVSCAVGPGFEFADFEMMRDDAWLAAEVRRVMPEVEDLI